VNAASPPVRYRDATPDDAEQIAGLYDRVYSGGYPVAELMDPVAIRQVLVAGADVWQLATIDDQVIGSVVGERAEWNRAYEICRGVVDPAFARGGRFRPLFDAIQRACVERADCELIPGYARSDHMQHICEVAYVPYAMLGSDGGKHLVSGKREEHVVVLAVNPLHRVGRTTPRVPLLTAGSDLHTRIARLGLDDKPGPYPPSTIIGPRGRNQFESDAGRLTYSYFEPSRCAAVTAVDAADPVDISRCLTEFLEEQPHRIEHLTVSVLADKRALISQLCATAFTMTAYVPAWYADGEKRYDCAWLTARLDPRTPVRLGTDALIRSLHADLAECVTPRWEQPQAA
jgi:hypothetical protein